MSGARTVDSRGPTASQQPAYPEYVPPTIRTYTSEEILEKIGPAQACSPSPCSTFP
jgi:hypothetical protein